MPPSADDSHTNGSLVDLLVPTPEFLVKVRDDLVTIAKTAGKMMESVHHSAKTVDTKMNTADLVTATDKAVETMVHTILLEKYPHIEFYGEETYTPGKRLTDAPTFVCDPIDGTVNFVHGFPNYCISLALTINKKPVVGVVYCPAQDHLYTACKGQGAWMNMNIKLPLTGKAPPLTTLNKTLCAVEWGSDRAGPNWECKFNTFRNLAGAPSEGGKIVHSLRSMGSAALNFCAVAKGEVDLYWEGGCWAWDVAAAWLILEETGGMVVDANPGGWEMTVDGRRYFAVRGCAGGKPEQKAIIEEFWSAVHGEYNYQP